PLQPRRSPLRHAGPEHRQASRRRRSSLHGRSKGAGGLSEDTHRRALPLSRPCRLLGGLAALINQTRNLFLVYGTTVCCVSPNVPTEFPPQKSNDRPPQSCGSQGLTGRSAIRGRRRVGRPRDRPVLGGSVMRKSAFFVAAGLLTALCLPGLLSLEGA